MTTITTGQQPDPGAADAARLRAWLESVEQLAAAEGLPPEGAA